MAGKKFNFAKQMANDRTNLLASSLIASLEVLKSDFGFNQDQLNKFSEKYIEALNKNSKKQ